MIYVYDACIKKITLSLKALGNYKFFFRSTRTVQTKKKKYPLKNFVKNPVLNGQNQNSNSATPIPRPPKKRKKIESKPALEHKSKRPR